MHPVLFQFGGITIYTYGFCIAVGASLAFAYLAWQGKKQYGLSFDKANMLSVLMIALSVVGGKIFFFLESPAYYLQHPGKLFSGSGFVFYGSLLFCIPGMLLYFRKAKLPVWGMLDIMAMVTCIVHGFGRIGCFNAGCCYGTHTDSFLGVIYTDEKCVAPTGQPLHPVQLYESLLIFLLLGFLWFYQGRKKFPGQLFLLYLIMYAAIRAALEFLRGDEARGYVMQDWLSHSQFIALIVMATALLFYQKRKQKHTIR